MAMLLFVRSTDDILPAMEAVSEFLAFRQQSRQRRPDGSRESDDLLVIWVDRDLDAALPAWFVPSLPSSGERPAAAPFSVRQSFSLSGIWTLCWIDISTSESELSQDSQREALIGTLADVFSARCSSSGAGPFFPVFGLRVPAESIETTMADLKARYAGAIGATWFVHDRSQGKIVPAERAGGMRIG